MKRPRKPKQVPPNDARRFLWKEGDLRWQLKACQLQMLAAILASTRFKYVIKCARRLGKSYLLCVLAIMTCLVKPEAQVRYAAPTAKALRKIVRPIMGKILRTCPKNLRPTFNSSEGAYIFPNGSRIDLAGVNNGHADDLRGTACDLFLIDEARDIDDLDYLVHDVAMPQFLDPDGNVVKGRRLVVASSPADSPGHEFTVMAQEAKAQGYYSEYDIFKGEYPLEVIQMFLEEDGVTREDIESLLSGKYTEIQSSTVKREYLAMDIVDEESAIVAEWKSPLYVYARQPTELDHFFHRYLWMDIGVKRDFTVILFAFYDFKRARIYIEDELIIKGTQVTTDKIAKAIKDKLKERPEYQQSYRRVADNSHPLLVNDLAADHQIYFTETDKARLHEMVNELKVWVGAGRVGIHPRCVHTIGAMEAGVWNKQRSEFARSPVFGHYDAIAAAVYGVRNVDQHTNPVPAYVGRTGKEWNPVPKEQPLSKTGQDMKSLFTSTLKRK